MDDRKITVDEVKPGMIGLAGGEEWIQKQIKNFTNSAWSHSFTVMNHTGELSVLETTVKYVHCIPLEEKASGTDYIAIWEPIVDPVQMQDASDRLYMKYIGMLYGYESYLWFIYRFIMSKFGKWPTKMWKIVANRVTCTELTVEGLHDTDSLKELFPYDLNTYSPQELFEVIETNPDKFRWVGWLRSK